ncbi:MAG: CdaR family protein [Candidatus Dormiibacterota bacterium]
MSWSLVTQDWRLKLLASGLAILMLGAVAFSQTTTATVKATIYYNNLPSGLMLLEPVDKINVFATGPADLIASLTSASITASADLTHLKKGSAVSVPIVVKSTDLRITVLPPPPITVNVDDQTSIALNVDVRTPVQATGWSVTQAVARCGPTSDPCKVTFVGPASVATGLRAFVTINDQIQALSTDSLNQTVEFEQNGRPIDITKLTTIPKITVDPSTVTAHVEAKRGTASVQVTLVDDTPTRRPSPGYRVTNITVDPVSVLCTGPADAIASLTAITLPGVDLGSSTSNASFKVQIPAPTGVTCSSATARVTYAISANPNTSPSPSASP